ncbi:alpha-1A adrenergic receptor-like [Limulus polyphemus]|uniref:Alpha-1A adrenergic receptor-like n=1 Tax=Limulus polyphemus TaxID=6850 RepID=A0ABM1TJN3_LIMPO|nr:alpha-1A adrenergic receptor-like [Limulus polyphemus]XP_022256088.1 alpha-1A adrenergic receptor-like [Limulus polyphemus]XP_022256089.1 alpha-1A adrenergic receptor-like [Limulus polyphemus]XP_022256090.1 alpha-1A adrenergic receptor-like [Limulus polyphemus]
MAINDSLEVIVLVEENVTFPHPLYDVNITDGRAADDVLLLIVKGTLLALFILLTVCGNMLVLMAVFIFSHLRTATNYFIVNLALADLLLGLTVLPFSASLELLKQWHFGEEFCTVWAATDVLCCTASIVSLCVISTERYIGVTQPLTYSSIVTRRRAIVACFAVWALSLSISVGPLLGWREPPPSDPVICEVNKDKDYVLFSVVFSFYIPLTIILILYFKIYKAAAKQTKFLETGVRRVRSSGNNSSEEITLRVHTGTQYAATSLQSRRLTDDYGDCISQRHLVGGHQGRLGKFRRQKKAAKTLGIVVGVFILCWFPFFFLLPLSALCEQCQVPKLLFDTVFWIGYFNSCLNPIIYARSSRDFQRAFGDILQCRWTRQTRSDDRRYTKNTVILTLRTSRPAENGRNSDSDPPVTHSTSRPSSRKTSESLS